MIAQTLNVVSLTALFCLTLFQVDKAIQEILPGIESIRAAVSTSICYFSYLILYKS